MLHFVCKPRLLQLLAQNLGIVRRFWLVSGSHVGMIDNVQNITYSCRINAFKVGNHGRNTDVLMLQSMTIRSRFRLVLLHVECWRPLELFRPAVAARHRFIKRAVMSLVDVRDVNRGLRGRDKWDIDVPEVDLSVIRPIVPKSLDNRDGAVDGILDPVLGEISTVKCKAQGDRLDTAKNGVKRGPNSPRV